jgi:hypothetical protein
MPKKPERQNLKDRKRCGGVLPGINAVLRVLSGLKAGVKVRVQFVIFPVVAYRLLEIGVDLGMDLGVENAVAFGSRS